MHAYINANHAYFATNLCNMRVMLFYISFLKLGDAAETLSSVTILLISPINLTRAKNIKIIAIGERKQMYETEIRKR